VSTLGECIRQATVEDQHGWGVHGLQSAAPTPRSSSPRPRGFAPAAAGANPRSWGERRTSPGWLTPTLGPVGRSERFKAAVAVYVLLRRRTGSGFHDGELALPAGHVDEGESVVAAVVRELAEELTIEVRPQDC